MRIAKWLTWIVLGLCALAMAGVLIVTQLVDPESFKPRLVEMVRESSGQELRLQGPMQLSWFPWLALQTGEGSLGPDANSTPLVRWRGARFGARLVPLLRGELTLDQVQLDGPVVSLRADAQGRGNWASLLERFSGSGGGGARFNEIAGIAMRDATLRYQSAAGTQLTISHWKLDTGVLRGGQPVHFDTQLEIALAAAAPAHSLSASGELLLEKGRLRLQALAASGVLHAAALAPTGLPITMKTPLLRGELATQRWSADDALLRIAGADVQTRNLLVSLQGAALQAQLDFNAGPFPLRPVLRAAGIAVPTTRDSTALGSFAARGHLSLDAASLAIELASLQIDATQLTGSVAVARPSGVIDFSLRGDRMDLDRYRAPENEPDKPFVFPSAELAALQARGQLQLERASVAGMDMRGVRLQLIYRDGAPSAVQPKQ